MTVWFAGPPTPLARDGRAGDVLEAPDHGTVLCWPTDRPATLDDVVVMGPRTRARYYRDTRTEGGCMRVRLRPGWAARFLGRPVREIADDVVPLREFAPPVDLRPLLAGAPTVPGDDETWQTRLVQEAARLLTGPRPETVARAARRLHVSERHLRGLFTAATGLSPRHYQQLSRVRAVLAHPRTPLPEVAAIAGYYDQSHMTAEFRRVMGAPPAAFRAGRWPAAESCRAG